MRIYWYRDHPDRYDSAFGALGAARHRQREEGGIIYDDSRAYILTDGEDTDVAVRISGDTISHEDARVILRRLHEANYDWRRPIDAWTLRLYARFMGYHLTR